MVGSLILEMPSENVGRLSPEKRSWGWEGLVSALRKTKPVPWQIHPETPGRSAGSVDTACLQSGESGGAWGSSGTQTVREGSAIFKTQPSGSPWTPTSSLSQGKRGERLLQEAFMHPAGSGVHTSLPPRPPASRPTAASDSRGGWDSQASVCQAEGPCPGPGCCLRT